MALLRRAPTRTTASAWPVHYRLPEDERLAVLERSACAPSRALLYPHKPGMAESLSAWARDFAAAHARLRLDRHVLPRAVGGGLRARGARGRDADLQGARAGRRLRPARRAARPRLGACWPRPGRRWSCTAAAARSPARTPARDRSARCWPRHPRLTAVIAHAGAPEYAEHLELAAALPERPPRHHDGRHAVPRTRWRRCGPTSSRSSATCGDRIVLGTDFPNIPYPYAEQLAALEAFDLGPTGCAPSAGTTPTACCGR